MERHNPFTQTLSLCSLFLSPVDPSLPIELLVEEEDEQVDVDFGLVEHLHDGHALVLQLQKVLDERTHTHTHTQI